MDLNVLIRELEAPSVALSKETNLTVEDIDKLASVMETHSNKFAEGIKCLANDFRKLAEKRKLAEEVVSKLLQNGSLETSKIFLKLSELIEKDTNDLTILNEALKLNKIGGFTLGTLGENDKTSDYSNPGEALKFIIDQVKGD